MADYGKIIKGALGAIKAAQEPVVSRLDMNFKDVTKRVPELTEAAQKVARGEMSIEQYADLVTRVKPVTPYGFVPQPATAEEAINALTSNKKAMFGKTKEIGAGEQADLRLDIPAYSQHGVWVNSIHRKDAPTVYGSTSAVKNATMIGSPDKAMKVATGETPKAPFAVIRGEWNPMEEADAVANAQKYLNHKDWRQVGYDPERHGYFYDRETMAPVLGAEEVIQIGPLVLAKKPKYGNPKDFPFRRGGGVHMGAGGALKALKALAKGETKAEGRIGDILASQTAPMTTPMGTGLPLLPRSAGMYPADVPQVDLPRMPGVDKARAAGKAPKYTERMQDLLDSPTARKKVNELIGKGEELGMREWYGTEPLRQAALDMGVSEDKFREFMAQMASASQRNPVDKQNQMGSYLWHLSQTGQLPEDAFLLTNAMKKGKKEMPQGTPVEFPPGYGSLAQSAILERGRQIAHEGAEAALPPNAKLGTFYRNLLGNLQPVTVDVNAVRGPVIARGDPRWLASKLVEKDEEGNIINTFKPRQMLESGEMSLKEARDRPGFWEAAPSGSEYAGFEDLWQRAAKRHGIAPAEAQALGWYGSADITALKTKPELYVENLERLIKRTAETTGKSQTEVLNDMLTGKGFLRKDGGAVESFSARLKAGIEQHMAVGGAVNMSDTRPDVTDAGGMIPAPFYAKGGPIKLNFKGLRGRKVQKFGDGGFTEPLGAPDAPVDPDTRQAIINVAGKGKEQLEREFKMLKDPKARADILKRIGLQTAGGGVDLLNLLASGVDIAQEQIPGLRKSASVLDPTGKEAGYQPKFRLASDKPALGSENLIEKAREAGLLGETEAPVTELLGSLALGAGAANPAKIRGGLNTMTAASRRPFTPTTVTMEAVAPDLAKFKPRDWQETTTRRLISGEGAPVSMSTMAGQRTTKRAGQGVYPNEAGQLETNPMVAVDVPAVGSLSKDKAFRRDISQAGKELGQESVAAHRFLPMLTNTMADANAVLIKPSKGSLSNEQVIELGRMLGGDMVVAHNPRLGGVVVYPFGETKGMPNELVQATQAAKTVLGEGANLRYGRVHPQKDTTYIPRADYAKEGAGEPSAASVAMRERLKKGEARLFREREKSTQ